MDCCGNCKYAGEDYEGLFCDYFKGQPYVRLNQVCENHNTISEIETFEIEGLTKKE